MARIVAGKKGAWFGVLLSLVLFLQCSTTASTQHSPSLVPLLAASLAQVSPQQHSTMATATAAIASAPVTPAGTAPGPSLAALGSHNFAPLTDSDLALINTILKARAHVTGPSDQYVYDTGLPPLQQLLDLGSGNKAAAAAAARLQPGLSSDRLAALAALSEPLGWLIRQFAVSGDILRKLRMTTELQLIIRDAISTNIAEAGGVPPGQVLTFATSNVSMVLNITGVRWPSPPPGMAPATAENYPGLAAVRAALSELAGGFDPQHISVELQSAAADAAVLAGDQQQLTQADEVGTVPVRATFYGLSPANTSSLLEALAPCSPSPAAAAAGGSIAAETAGGAVLGPVAGLPLLSNCTATFQRWLLGATQVQVLDTSQLYITPVAPPQATVTLAVAVGLTRQQALQDVDERTSAWLNSSAVHDILQDFNLTAVSTDSYRSYVVSPVAGGGQGPVPGLSPAVVELVIQQGPAVSKGMLAGIIVAAVMSMLALGSVALLLIFKKMGSKAAEQQQETLPTTTPDAARRRRRQRPRVYNNKYLTAGMVAQHHDRQLMQEQQEQDVPKPGHLERGDSVTSAIHFEAEEAAAGADAAEASSSSSGSSSSSDSTACARPCNQQLEIITVGAALAQPMLTNSQAVSIHLSDNSCSSRNALADLPLSRSATTAEAAVAAAAVAVAAAEAADKEEEEEEEEEEDAEDEALVSHRLQRLAQQQQQQQGQLLPQRHSTDSCKAVSSAGGDAVAASFSDGCPALQPLCSSSQTTAAPAAGTTDVASAFAAMDVQLAAAAAAGSRSSSGGSRGGAGSSGSQQVQPLAMSCWHQPGHESGFLVPSYTGSGVEAPEPKKPAALVSPFAMAFSVASDASTAAGGDDHV